MSSDSHNTLSLTEYESMTDEQLVEYAKQYDSIASDMLYQRYKNIVRGRARPYFLMGADREDLVQEGMIGFFKSVRDYDPQKNASFRPFAEMCVVRQILTAIKAASRNKHIPLNKYESLYKSVYDENSEKQLLDLISSGSAMNPEELFIRKETADAMEKALRENLTLFEKAVLEFYMQGMTYSGIAEKLSRDTKSVDNALQRIRKKLEKTIATIRN